MVCTGSMSGKLGTSEDKRTKMEITVNSVIAIISLLKPGDRFGCVTFNDVCQTERVDPERETNMRELGAVQETN